MKFKSNMKLEIEHIINFETLRNILIKPEYNNYRT